MIATSIQLVQFVSASEMTYIVSSGALNSTHSPNSSLLIRLVRGGISQRRTRTRTPCETRRDRYYYRSSWCSHEFYVQ